MITSSNPLWISISAPKALWIVNAYGIRVLVLTISLEARADGSFFCLTREGDEDFGTVFEADGADVGFVVGFVLTQAGSEVGVSEL